VSFHLPLSLTLRYKRGISAVPRDRRRRFRGTRRRKHEIVKDLHQLKKLSQGPVRRPAGLNSPATRSSAGFVMREIQTGLHKPEGGTKQRLTKSAYNSAPVCLPNCALICLGSRVSYDLPLALDVPRGTGMIEAPRALTSTFFQHYLRNHFFQHYPRNQWHRPCPSLIGPGLPTVHANRPGIQRRLIRSSRPIRTR